MRGTAAVLASLGLLRAEANADSCRRLAAATLAIMTASALAAAAPLGLKATIDHLSESGAKSDLGPALFAGALYVAAIGGARTVSELRPWLLNAVELQLATGLRGRFFAHLLRLPLEFHFRQRSGALLQTIHHGTAGVRMLLTALFGSILPVLIEFACITFILVVLRQPGLLLCFVLSSLAHLILFTRRSTQLGQQSRDVVDASRRSQSILADCLSHVEALKVCNGERWSCGRLGVATARERVTWSALQRHRLSSGLLGALVFVSVLATGLLMSGRAVAAGELSLGGFVLANAYILQVIRPMETLGAGLRDLIQASAWLQPLIDTLAIPGEEEVLQKREAAPPTRGSSDAAPAGRVGLLSGPPPAISAQRLGLSYGPRRQALQAIDFDLPSGGTLALVGPSGSGKSSLLRLILRLYEPEAGRLLVDGQPIDRMVTSDLRRMIGFVPQEGLLMHDSIAANILLGDSEATIREVEDAARLAGLDEWVTALPDGLKTLVGERGLQVSGGERQRITIARALLRRPRILLFDEATSMLDSETEAGVMRNIREASTGCTTIIVAHRLSTIVHADEILVLDRGRVVERGRHAELLATAGRYARTWQAQIGTAPT